MRIYKKITGKVPPKGADVEREWLARVKESMIAAEEKEIENRRRRTKKQLAKENDVPKRKRNGNV